MRPALRSPPLGHPTGWTHLRACGSVWAVQEWVALRDFSRPQSITQFGRKLVLRLGTTSNLHRTRDLLLPRLLSGQMEVEALI